MADKKSGGVSPAAAGVAGAVVGAAVGAAAIALSDKKTRKKVLDKLNELKLQAGDQFGELRDDLQKWVEENANGVMGGSDEKKKLSAGKGSSSGKGSAKKKKAE